MKLSSISLALMVLIFVYLSSAELGHCDIKEGLIAYFSFDEGKGTSLKDGSGNKHDAEIKGKAEWVDGKYGKALKFDGKDSYAEIAPGTIDPFDSVTMTAWVKVSKMPSTHSYNIVGMTLGPGSGFYIELYKVDLAAWLCPPNINASFPYPGDFSEWHHVAGVYSSSEIRLYIDGQMKSRGAGAKLPDIKSLPFRISGDHPETGNWAGSIDGIIDEVRLYGRTLNDKEIIETMKPMQGMNVAPRESVLTLWGKIKALF